MLIVSSTTSVIHIQAHQIALECLRLCHIFLAIGGRKKPRAPGVQRARTRAERAELRQKKYRYLYQVRTAHGDVISQVS